MIYTIPGIALRHSMACTCSTFSNWHNTQYCNGRQTLLRWPSNLQFSNASQSDCDSYQFPASLCARWVDNSVMCSLFLVGAVETMLIFLQVGATRELLDGWQPVYYRCLKMSPVTAPPSDVEQDAEHSHVVFGDSNSPVLEPRTAVVGMQHISSSCQLQADGGILL